MRFLYIYFLFFTFSINAQSLVKTYINELANTAPMKYGSLSVAIIDVNSGEILEQYNPNRSLIPASILKTITTGTGLIMLGEDYRYQTLLQHDGYIENGVLHGNIYIKGSGDPTLGSPEMEGVQSMSALIQDMTQAIKSMGIREIKGAVIGDASIFETAQPAPTWGWNDLGNYYGCGASGLNIHENLYYLSLQQKSTLGSTPQVISVRPKIPYLSFTSELKSAAKGTGDNAYIFGAPNTYHRYIRGTIPVGSQAFRIEGSIPDPAFYTAYLLVEALKDAGVQSPLIAKNGFEWEREGNSLNTNRTLIKTYSSPTLLEIATRANEKSVNLYCEAILKTLGQRQYGEGSTEAGAKAITEFWQARGINLDGFFLEDGSGLSPRNATSSFHIASMLRSIAKDPSIYNNFKSSLALGGRTGTVRYMFKGTSAEGKIRVKSGSMTRVRSYAGYGRTKSGRLVAFSIIANNFTGKSTPIRKKMEKIMAAIYEY